MLNFIKSKLVANNKEGELRFAWVNFPVAPGSSGCHVIHGVTVVKNLLPLVGCAA